MRVNINIQILNINVYINIQILNINVYAHSRNLGVASLIYYTRRSAARARGLFSFCLPATGKYLSISPADIAT